MRPDELRPGEIFAGKYRIRAILGRDHGLLVDANNIAFEQRVAIKILLPGFGDDTEIERFRREARVLAKLESEHAARIIDVGSHEGAFYLVRQFLDGIDLATLLRKRGPMPIEDAVLYLLQAAEAIAETHTHGIVLRELSPSKLFLTERAGGPSVKLIDFGTAKLVRDASAATGELTATTMVGLSPYGAPEVIRKAQDVDARADVWSLGAVLYELLTGRPPFSGDMASLMMQIMRDEPMAASRLRPDMPRDLDPILGWCLAKDPAGRFANVHALAHALTPFAPAEGRVLIERIGRISRAVHAHSFGAPAASIADEDSITSEHEGERVAEQTVFMGQYVPPAAASQPRSVAPPRASFAGAATGLAPSSSPSQPASVSASAPPPMALDPAQRMAGSASPWGGAPAPRAAMASVETPRRGGGNRRLAMVGIAVPLVLLPLLVVVLLTRKGDSSASSEDAGVSASSTEAPIVVAAPTALSPVLAPSSSASAVEPPPAAPTVEPQPASPAAAQPAPTGKGKVFGSSPTPTSQAVAPPPPPPPPPPQVSGSGSGTLVAVAIGGSCAFSVNGATKGNGTSVKIPLPAGSYSVSCKPASGATKSRSVTIKGGDTVMAMFKLQ
jgi:serine/threonine-protein kinase